MTAHPSVVSPDESVGIIVPPPEVKEILETTATYVGKKPALEARVLEKHDNDVRFSFLKVSDPYHAYYRSKVAQVRAAVNTEQRPPQPAPVRATTPNGDATPTNEKRGSAPQENGQALPNGEEAGPNTATSLEDGKGESKDDKADEKNTTQRTAKVSFLKSIRAKEEAARPEPREHPPDDTFTLLNVNPPPHALALDVMKLVAQFVAKHGLDFLLALASKESRNNLFDFLKPLHPHSIVFQRLVDAYTSILSAGEGAGKLVAKGKDQAEVEKAIMGEVWYMHDWECQRAEREHEAAMDESEKLKVAQIDWHDFVVLETVTLDENEQDLPAPVPDAKQLPKILAAAKKAEQEREKNRGNVDMDVDPSGDPPPRNAVSSQVQTKDGMVVTANVDSEIPADRIRKNPAPSRAEILGDSRQGQTTEEPTVVLPSGQRVLESKAEASMRAELLNPSYKDERARAAAKNQMQNLADGEEMARNLARLDRQRTEAGVYNRGDLQGALATLPKPSPAEADATLRRAEPSGPKMPGMEEELSPPAKRARVEAAKEALEKAPKKKDAAAAAAEEETAVAEVAGIAVAETIPGLMSAEDWLRKHGPTAQVRIKVPVHSNKEWNLQGQEIEMKAPLKSMVSKLKGAIAKWTKLPANKQKLLIDGVGFLKDKMTLAYYNVGHGTRITLEVKERGGRKRHH